MDIAYMRDPDIDFDDVMIVPQRSSVNSRGDVSVVVPSILDGRLEDFIPIVVSNMDSTGTLAMASSLCPHGALVAISKYCDDRLVSLVMQSREEVASKMFVTFGITKDEMNRLDRLTKRVGDIPLICIDAANGYTDYFMGAVKVARNMQPGSVIMAGNVVTTDVAIALLHEGADIIKLGIGSGSVCATREKTGVGVPQLQAILDCAGVVHAYGGAVCSDGGIRNPGDVCKALCAGADIVMSGRLFAGTDECNALYLDSPHAIYEYHGMASASAQREHNGSVKPYATEEGRSTLVPTKGPALDVLNDILGGIRSCCTYIGANSVDSMPYYAKLRKVMYHGRP